MGGREIKALPASRTDAPMTRNSRAGECASSNRASCHCDYLLARLNTLLAIMEPHCGTALVAAMLDRALRQAVKPAQQRTEPRIGAFFSSISRHAALFSRLRTVGMSVFAI